MDVQEMLGGGLLSAYYDEAASFLDGRYKK